MLAKLADEKILLTIPEAAAATGYSRSFLYEQFHRGLPVVRIGRTVRVRTDQLRDWIDRQQQDDGES